MKRQHTTQKAFPPPSPNTPLRQPASAHMAASGLRCTRTMGCVTGCFSPVYSARCAHLFGRTTANHSPGSEKYACAANNTPPRDPFQPLFFLTPLLSFVHSSTSHLPPDNDSISHPTERACVDRLHHSQLQVRAVSGSAKSAHCLNTQRLDLRSLTLIIPVCLFIFALLEPESPKTSTTLPPYSTATGHFISSPSFPELIDGVEQSP